MNNPKKTNSIRLLNTYKFWGTMLLLFGTFCIPACKIYRFTDASVDPNWKTFSVAPTINVATLQNPNAAPTFTDKLKESFLRNTRLTLIRDSGDLEFSVTITEYNVEPVAITNTETTAQNRLNISVKVDCVNQRDKAKSFSQTFRDGENYGAGRQLSDVENSLINTIFDRLVQQIFNRTFGNW
ncbi:MAG TPA: LptE family protein [Chitinophagales bacterium]|nr:LptE family protein [Chitinophagales bacterium]HNM32903.1 LptE family protein [Chitinophagales bacterium]